MNYNNEDILKLLNLPNDESLKIDSLELNSSLKIVNISRDPVPTYCHSCGAIMHSKGIFKRSLYHQILQDTTTLKIVLHQRKYKCTNCGVYKNEKSSFVEKQKQSTTLIPYFIFQAMKDLNRSTTSIAKQFNLSDTQVPIYLHGIWILISFLYLNIYVLIRFI